MQVAVFHPGTQHSWQTAYALQQLGRLHWFATSLFYRPDRFPYSLERIVPGRFGRLMQREFSRFSFPAIDPEKVITPSQHWEWLERGAARLGLSGLAGQLDRVGNARFGKALKNHLRSTDSFALWGYNGSSLHAFEVAKDIGRTCILDRTIGDWRYYNRAMEGVRKTHAEWFVGRADMQSAAVIESEDRELELADLIVCGSDFAANTLCDYAPDNKLGNKLRVLPYCFDPFLFNTLPDPAPSARDRPVRFLFLGLGSPRKGIHHALEAVAQLPRAEATLTIAGRLHIPDQVFARFSDRVTHVPTVPRSEVPELMAGHDCLVLPSYFEGSSLALIEALASGLAIIQTPQAGTGVTPQTGILIERPDTELLVAAMRRMIDDRSLLDSCRFAAPGEAAKFTATRYMANIADLLESLER